MSRIAQLIQMDKSIVVFNGLGDRIFAVIWHGRKMSRDARDMVKRYIQEFEMSPSPESLQAFPWIK